MQCPLCLFASQRIKARRHYNEGEHQDDEIEGRRTWNLERKISDRPGTFCVFDGAREQIQPLDSGTRFSASFHLHLPT